MKKIILVEDCRDMNKLITKILTVNGFSVDACYDGETALELLSKNSYDGIVTDYQLPGINGLKILETLASQSIRKVMLSAYGSITLKQNVEKLGAVFMDKPFDNEELVRQLRK
jgi:DNA-binding response OmpR family regulator